MSEDKPDLQRVCVDCGTWYWCPWDLCNVQRYWSCEQCRKPKRGRPKKKKSKQEKKQ